MYRVIWDLFLAGSETTSAALDWACLYMSQYPKIQKKCQDEIQTVIMLSFHSLLEGEVSLAQSDK